MSSNVQELISKIKTEGFEEAQKQAQAIEDDARKKAAMIISDAQAQAVRIVEEAQATAHKLDAATRLALEQAARNVLLALRQDILDLLKKLVAREVSQALTGDHLVNLVEVVARSAAGAVQMTLNESDLAALKEVCLARLQADVRRGVTLTARSGRAKGLTISFDQNKSCFDLTEGALADYFTGFVSEQIGQLLRK
jgi:V/A-type H+-transporting ATPase subunit E